MCNVDATKVHVHLHVHVCPTHNGVQICRTGLNYSMSNSAMTIAQSVG